MTAPTGSGMLILWLAITAVGKVLMAAWRRFGPEYTHEPGLSPNVTNPERSRYQTDKEAAQ